MESDSSPFAAEGLFRFKGLYMDGLPRHWDTIWKSSVKKH